VDVEYVDNRLCRGQSINDQKTKERQSTRGGGGGIPKPDRSLKKVRSEKTDYKKNEMESQE